MRAPQIHAAACRAAAEYVRLRLLEWQQNDKRKKIDADGALTDAGADAGRYKTRMDYGFAPQLMAGLRPPAKSRGALPRGQAALSLLLHGALLAVVMSVAVRPQPQPAETAMQMVVLPPPPAAPSTQTLQRASLSAVQPERVTEALRPPPPLSISPDGLARPRPPHRQSIALAKPAARLAAPASPAAPPAQAPIAASHVAQSVAPASAATAPPAAALAALEAQVRAAVQAALIYPPAARFRHEQGRVRVRFDYQDGEVNTVSVAVPSGAPILDVSALETVRRAAMPRPPAEIGTRRLAMLVWVDFGLTDAD